MLSRVAEEVLEELEEALRKRAGDHGWYLAVEELGGGRWRASFKQSDGTIRHAAEASDMRNALEDLGIATERVRSPFRD
jgi:hypothetical protein